MYQFLTNMNRTVVIITQNMDLIRKNKQINFYKSLLIFLLNKQKIKERDQSHSQILPMELQNNLNKNLYFINK